MYASKAVVRTTTSKSTSISITVGTTHIFSAPPARQFYHKMLKIQQYFFSYFLIILYHIVYKSSIVLRKFLWENYASLSIKMGSNVIFEAETSASVSFTRILVPRV